MGDSEADQKRYDPIDDVVCEKCGNDDQDQMVCEPDHFESAHGKPKNPCVYLAGYRCKKCGHLSKIES